MEEFTSSSMILNKVYETIINSQELKMLLNYSKKYDELVNGVLAKSNFERNLAYQNLHEAQTAKTSFGNLTFFKKFSKEGIKMKLHELKIPKYNKIYNKKSQEYNKLKGENENQRYFLFSELEKHRKRLFPEYLKKVLQENNLDFTMFDYKFVSFEYLPIDIEAFKYELSLKLNVIKYSEEKFLHNQTEEYIIASNDNYVDFESDLTPTSKKAS